MQSNPSKTIHIALLGVGNVARSLLDYLDRHDFAIQVSALADSSGAMLLGPEDRLPNLLAQKKAGNSLCSLAGERCIRDAGEFIRMLPAAGIPVLVESLPTNIRDGQPAFGLIRAALNQGTSVVTVDKGPLVHGFAELNEVARQSGARVAYGGTTGVRAPDTLVPNPTIGDSSLPHSRVLEIRGILNGTTNYILTEMQRGGLSFQNALARATSDGVAEPDPSLDVEGWDTACKILILAKQLMGAEAGLDQVSRIGIGPETESLISVAKSSGRIVRLAGRARIWQGRVRVSVAPKLVGPDSPFFSVSGTSKAAIFRTAEQGEVVVHSTSGRDAIAEIIVEDVLRISAA